MDDKRRASPGCTHEPYPCCGRPPESRWGRRKGTICSDCESLIEDGKRLRAAIPPTLVPFWWTERNYAWQKWYPFEWTTGNHGSPSSAHDELTAAFFALVASVTTPAPPDTPRDTGVPQDDTALAKHLQWAKGNIPWEQLIPVPEGRNYRDNHYEFKTLVLCTPETRAVLNHVYTAIGEALEAGHRGAKARGLSLLRGLASGETSIHDYNEHTLETPRKR